MSNPLLDNIETSPQTKQALKSVDTYGFFGSRLIDDLYSDNQMKSLHLAKVLSERVATALIDYGTGTSDRGLKIRECGTFLVADPDGAIVGANFCRQRLCPLCQKRRSLRTYSDFKKIMDKLTDYRFVHLVLTVPNCSAEALPFVLDNMQIASTALFNHCFCKAAFKGVARFTEISYNAHRNDYHPHFHCLIAVNKSYATSRDYIKRERLRSLWTYYYKEANRGRNFKRRSDDGVIAFVASMAAYLNPDEQYQIYISFADEGALPEIAKYCVKPLSFDIDTHKLAPILEALLAAMHSRRMVQLYGVIREVAHELNIDFEVDEAEPLPDDIKLTRYLWGYNSDTGCYAYYCR